MLMPPDPPYGEAAFRLRRGGMGARLISGQRQGIDFPLINLLLIPGPDMQTILLGWGPQSGPVIYGQSMLNRQSLRRRGKKRAWEKKREGTLCVQLSSSLGSKPPPLAQHRTRQLRPSLYMVQVTTCSGQPVLESRRGPAATDSRRRYLQRS
ncbi:hypothetical protein SKAU_G00084730 [Synaphobranchus kaupii]|uniref:Uncharacterized protein n=1 Tax=Synaphobranchus kaupii TaxID=118154 RepID=A0A9Q1J3N2_SYNKA|nr:hypothetical protein SKAU_G00084730 [Synaphobranchus kaupii]